MRDVFAPGDASKLPGVPFHRPSLRGFPGLVNAGAQLPGAFLPLPRLCFAVQCHQQERLRTPSDQFAEPAHEPFGGVQPDLLRTTAAASN